MAELVFINPHQFRDPYLYTRGIHEYTHVDNKQAFYRAGDAFLKKPPGEQLQMLQGLKD